MDIEFLTNDESKKISLLSIREVGGSEFVCQAVVKSGWLSCDRQFYFSKYYAQAFLSALRGMNESLCGEAILQTEYEEQFIKITCGERGGVNISGEFVEHAELPQKLEFNFETDQTVFLSLLQQFEQFLAKYN
jgi:hypothetical protein